MAKCSVDNCPRDAGRARGMCDKHYAQWRRTGRVFESGYISRKGKVCAAEGCTVPVKTKGYCGRHYQQVLKFGNALPTTRREPNRVIHHGAYCELVLTNQDGVEIATTKIDTEDLDRVRAHGRWTLDDQDYVTHNVYAGSAIVQRLRLHRFIMGVDDERLVDHRNKGTDRLDNRKSNLRVATVAQNNVNVGMRADNTSGYKGVYASVIPGHWFAQITVQGKTKYLGTFKSRLAASAMYKVAARKAHGEFYRET